MNITIYTVTHKKVDLTLPACYQKIAVGKITDDELDNTYVKDNVGINISGKNPNYCELTAQYWIWQNDRSDVVGLCHYRRFLTSHRFSNDVKYILNDAEIFRELAHGTDIILPYRPFARRTVKEIYCDYGTEKDWNILKDCLAELEPEYLQEFTALEQRHSNYSKNILICRKNLFDQYSEWLFRILFEVENRVDLTAYDAQYVRIFGYMSERLLEVWVRTNHLRIRHYRLLNTEEKTGLQERLIEALGIALNRFKY